MCVVIAFLVEIW